MMDGRSFSKLGKVGFSPLSFAPFLKASGCEGSPGRAALATCGAALLIFALFPYLLTSFTHMQFLLLSVEGDR